MQNGIFTEIVEFSLAGGITEEDFRSVVDQVETGFHAKCSGFIDTELVRKRDGNWIMIQHWASSDEGKEAIRRMMKDPLTEDFRQAINPKSVKMELLEQVDTWKK